MGQFSNTLGLEGNLSLGMNKGALQLVTSSSKVTLTILKIRDYPRPCCKSVCEDGLEQKFLYYHIF